jgi:hypothetical protein
MSVHWLLKSEDKSRLIPDSVTLSDGEKLTSERTLVYCTWQLLGDFWLVNTIYCRRQL